jgi:predicted enzyme related to lactoylglutathione lyase
VGIVVNRDTAWAEGTPCWVDLGVADIAKALTFYSAQFGWEIEMGGPEVGGYSVATVGGRSAAGIGPKMGGEQQPTMWMTYLAADDADAVAAKITGAGGQVIVGPMDVMDLGRMAVATDTTGGVFGIWQARKMTGAQVANVAGALTWTEQMSHDFETAKKFYGAVFGYEFGDMSSEGFSYATLDLDGRQVGGIGGYPQGVPAGTPGSWAVYFGVADTDAAVATATAIGGTVEHQPTDTPYGRMAMLVDDQGARFSILSVRPE